MAIIFRNYNGTADYELIGNFLIEKYQDGNKDGNWFQPAWEYMHFHPQLDEASLSKIGIWEDNNRIVGVVHYESKLGEVFFEIHPAYKHLKAEMLDYAEKNLIGETKDRKKYVNVFINDFDKEFEHIIKSRGYIYEPSENRPMSKFDITDPFPEIIMPRGFKLKSLKDDNDINKIHKILWRGFNHTEEVPKNRFEALKRMQSTPNFRHDLTIVTEAPNGDFASFCGMWYDKVNKIAYVEPVATDPDYRRMGLGKAAVLEGIRRCKELGAAIAYVASNQKFYQSFGFKLIYNSNCWVKVFDDLSN